MGVYSFPEQKGEEEERGERKDVVGARRKSERNERD